MNNAAEILLNEINAMFEGRIADKDKLTIISAWKYMAQGLIHSLASVADNETDIVNRIAAQEALQTVHDLFQKPSINKYLNGEENETG